MVHSSTSAGSGSSNRDPLVDQNVPATAAQVVSSPTTIIFDLNHSPVDEVEEGEIPATTCDLSLSLAVQVITDQPPAQPE